MHFVFCSSLRGEPPLNSMFRKFHSGASLQYSLSSNWNTGTKYEDILCSMAIVVGATISTYKEPGFHVEWVRAFLEEREACVAAGDHLQYSKLASLKDWSSAPLFIEVMHEFLVSFITFFVIHCVIIKLTPIALALFFCNAKRQAWQGSFEMQALVYRMLRRLARRAQVIRLSDLLARSLLRASRRWNPGASLAHNRILVQ